MIPSSNTTSDAVGRLGECADKPLAKPQVGWVTNKVRMQHRDALVGSCDELARKDHPKGQAQLPVVQQIQGAKDGGACRHEQWLCTMARVAVQLSQRKLVSLLDLLCRNGRGRNALASAVDVEP